MLTFRQKSIGTKKDIYAQLIFDDCIYLLQSRQSYNQK